MADVSGCIIQLSDEEILITLFTHLYFPFLSNASFSIKMANDVDDDDDDDGVYFACSQ